MSEVNRAEAGPAAAGDGDIAALIGVFRRNILLILGIAALVVAAMLAYLSQAKPRYTARAVVELAPQKAEVGREANDGPAPVPKDADVDAQVEDLKSRDLAVTVVKQLHLDALPSAKPPKATLRAAKRPGDFTLPPEPGVTPEQASAADALSSGLKSRRMGQTFLTEIAYTSRDPVLAARIANAVAEAYVAKELNGKNQVSRTANGALTGKLDSLRQQVLEADAAVASYQTSHNLLGTNDAPLSQQDLALQSAQVVGAQSDEAQATARYNAARMEAARGGSGEAMSEAQASPVIAQLRAARADSARKVAELQTRYGPLYPDLVTAKHELAETDLQISAELGRIMSALRSQADSARARASALQASNNQLRSSLAAGTTASVELDDLKRKAEAARTLYEAVLARSKETSVQQAFAQADVRIDTPATPPAVPSSPNKPVDIFLSVVLGLGLGCGVALIRDRMVRGFNTSEEVERRLNVPYLGSIPTLASSVKKAKTGSPVEAIGKHPFSNFAESFRTLATSLRHGRDTGEVRILLVTSALPGEGKTTTAICLARVIAMGGASVAFLDCDLRRRSASAALRLQPEHGLIEVLAGRARIEDAMVTLPEMGFDVLPLAKEAHLAKSPFESAEMDDLLGYLKTRYDVVVIDTAPVLPVVDTRVLAEKADAVALLARWRSTPAQATATALRMLTALNVRVDGVALTQVDLKQQARAGNTSDAAYYYKAYQGYYTD